MTNEELAGRLGRDAGSMLHHVRLLVKTGFLEPEGERRGARGAVERPYRATGKSWTINGGEEDGAGASSPSVLALVDAFRDEVAETPKEEILLTSRLGVRLTPEQLAAFTDRFERLVDDLKGADDAAGAAYGFFIGAHRRQE